MRTEKAQGWALQRRRILGDHNAGNVGSVRLKAIRGEGDMTPKTMFGRFGKLNLSFLPIFPLHIFCLWESVLAEKEAKMFLPYLIPFGKVSDVDNVYKLVAGAGMAVM